MNKNKLLDNLKKSHSTFWEIAILLPNPTISINGKWSVNENVEHINIALIRVTNFLALPKSSIQTTFGLTERASTSYETIIKVFKNALENGVKTTDAFIPHLKPETNIEELVSNGEKLVDALISTLQNWSEEELDMYNCPHPFLGKVTVREILYFNIHHVQHHTETLIKMK